MGHESVGYMYVYIYTHIVECIGNKNWKFGMKND